MKIYFGKYKSGVTPWSISKSLLFFLPEKSQLVENLGDILAYGKIIKDEDIPNEVNDLICYYKGQRHKTILFKLLDKLNETRLFKRTEYIKVDDYDVWNMNETLISIIRPLLNEYVKQKNGSPTSTNDDVPEHLKNTGDLYNDTTVHERWDYIVSEMVYSFSEKTIDEYYDDLLSEQDVKRMKNGHILFGKYLTSMWT